jgi:CHASE2 domain-containing sensor protein
MKGLLFISIGLAIIFCKAQSKDEIVIITVNRNYYELTETLKFLNAHKPKLICINVDLLGCDNDNSHTQIQDNAHFDSLATHSVIYPSEVERKLSLELNKTHLLLMPSKLRPLGEQGNVEVIGCGFLYPERVATGYTDLILNEKHKTHVEKFRISSLDSFNEFSYHFAVKIALFIDDEKTNNFIRSNENTVSIDFNPNRKFTLLNFNDFAKKKVIGNFIDNKVVIIGLEDEYFLVAKDKKAELRRMTTSEIFANIVMQILSN